MTNSFVKKFSKIRGVEAAIFGLVLLFLPVNLAKHFFFDFCYVDGILVDYLIPTVYLTDILVGALLLLWLFRSLRYLRYSSTYCCTTGVNRSLVVFGLGMVAVSGLSVLQAQNQPAAVYRWLKLAEYILFTFYISKHIDPKKDWPTVIKLLSIGVLFESFLAIAQWFKQGSVFGFWFFGENRYTVSTPGIATFDFAGVKKVRPYGTFPHPNALGGYLAIVLPWVFYELKNRIKNTELRIKGRGLSFLTFGLGFVALFLSFSRSAWIVGILGLLASFPSSILNSSFMILNSLSFLRRAELNWIALEMVKDHPLLGVGLNNFTVAMGQYGKVSGWTRFLQPVHNVYLLVAAEIGLLGLAVFLCLLFSSFKSLASSFRTSKLHQLLLISLTQIILLSFVDHYFWTLQQTSLLFWLLVGLSFSLTKE